LTKKDLVELVAKKGNLTNKAARDAVSSFLNGVRDSLKRGEKVFVKDGPNGDGIYQLIQIKD